MSRYSSPVVQHRLRDESVASGAKLHFYENGSLVTQKDTWADAARTIKNTNPVTLDSEGNTPNIFGQGTYTVKLMSASGVQQWVRDDVEFFEESSRQFADWSTLNTYSINEIVRASDGNYYKSLSSSNAGNNPTTAPTYWSQLVFLVEWNTSETYSEGDTVTLDGLIYRSLADDNQGNNPRTSPSQWAADTIPDFSDWLSDYSYSTGQAVAYSGAYYRSLIDSNLGNTPANNANWELVFLLVRWNTNKAYAADDLVVYDGQIYRSLVSSNAGHQPDTSATQWESIAKISKNGTSSAGDLAEWAGTGGAIQARSISTVVDNLLDSETQSEARSALNVYGTSEVYDRNSVLAVADRATTPVGTAGWASSVEVMRITRTLGVAAPLVTVAIEFTYSGSPAAGAPQLLYTLPSSAPTATVGFICASNDVNSAAQIKAEINTAGEITVSDTGATAGYSYNGQVTYSL